MILADTNVVSEFMSSRPQPAVLEWAATVPPDELAIPAVVVQEMEYGIYRLDDGPRQRDLLRTWRLTLAAFADRVVPYDHRAAERTAATLVDAERRGRRMSLADAQIAGIAVAHDAQLATRNTRDFEGVEGLQLLNPFEPH
ncbi:MAG: type II toxin-antitoxin system VapC family toxin [Micrococcales bacterium]|nr:type II toxin-antitoxin system VapC family toxin [Micrococcales bacterium]